ncbi:MAG: alpha/beta hydrolase [Lachnospiraceae bacterium]|nr:alpha/beta hydrolase [Lachnospiraceae bacterium]
MALVEKYNQNLMQIIKRMHGMLESSDVEKQRHSQEQLATVVGNQGEALITDLMIEEMHAEWVSVERAHLKKYVILYCHGGGYSTGSSLYARSITTKLANAASMDVFSFDYRLAPENPYPAATEDAMKAWNHLMLHGYGARDVIVAGDSAGGNLALSLVHKLKQENRLLPRGLVLFSPWTDLTCSGKTYETRKMVDPILSKKYIEDMIQNYAQGENLDNPLISPLFGSFEGFPPTYIQVGDNEILLADAISLQKKMLRANVSVKLDVFKGMWHVFQMAPFKKALEAMDKSAEFIYDICG